MSFILLYFILLYSPSLFSSLFSSSLPPLLCSIAEEHSVDEEWLFGTPQRESLGFPTAERTTVTIENVPIGARTVGENPILGDYDPSFAETRRKQLAAGAHEIGSR